MKTTKPISTLSAIFGLILITSSPSLAWMPVENHEPIERRALELFRQTWTDTGCLNSAIFQSSQNQISGTIQDLLVRGSIDEDAGGRGLYHFYNPIDNTGLDQGSFVPSLKWATIDMPLFSNQFNYNKARQFYLNALQQTGQPRSRNFCDYYYSVGMLMHLVQDLTQPEHVRNDAHLAASQNVEGGFLEILAANVPGGLNSRLAAAAARGIQTQAPIRFNRFDNFWEDRQVDLTGGTDGQGGIAEIVNWHFFSPDTIRDTAHFPHPDYPADIAENPDMHGVWTGMTETITTSQGKQVVVTGRYLTLKHAQPNIFGNQPVRLAREGYFTKYSSVPNTWILSKDVIEDYATIQWPLAVRASAGVLHHFFPGWTIDATAALQGDTLKISGTIRHNREPGTFRWNDAVGNGTSRVTLLGQGITAPITLPFAVADGAFETAVHWPSRRAALGLPTSAMPETAILTFDIGAERYAETMAVGRISSLDSITFNFGYHAPRQPLSLSGAAYLDTDGVYLSRIRKVGDLMSVWTRLIGNTLTQVHR